MNYLIESLKTKAQKMNGKCRVRIITESDIDTFIKTLKRNPKAKRIRVYCQNAFVAVNYKYVAKTRYIEYKKKEGISLGYASAFRSHGRGSEIVIVS